MLTWMPLNRKVLIITDHVIMSNVVDQIMIIRLYTNDYKHLFITFSSIR